MNSILVLFMLDCNCHLVITLKQAKDIDVIQTLIVHVHLL
jgi:hypothetical protein